MGFCHIGCATMSLLVLPATWWWPLGRHLGLTGDTTCAGAMLSPRELPRELCLWPNPRGMGRSPAQGCSHGAALGRTTGGQAFGVHSHFGVYQEADG